jgi:hypothetical protein
MGLLMPKETESGSAKTEMAGHTKALFSQNLRNLNPN